MGNDKDIFVREEKSNFGLTQIIDPIGLFGGRPIWDTNASSEEQKAAYQMQQQQQREQMLYQQRMRDLAERSASSERAFQIRNEMKKAERSAKMKTGLIVGGIALVTLTIGGIVAYKIIKKK